MMLRCEKCGHEFEPCDTEEEARAEQHRLFPGVPDAECALVCDDCFKVTGLEANVIIVCPDCQGTGTIENLETNELDICHNCDGRGYIDGGEEQEPGHRIEEPT